MSLRPSLMVIATLLAITRATGAPPAPDDPSAPVPASTYSPVLKGTKAFKPVEPRPWAETNKRVSPPPKQTGKPAR
jgi:hypothetical protein